MLQIKSLNIIHKKDLRTILEDFELILNDGDKAVIIGEEGNGKSTLLKWIFNPILVEDYTESTGKCIHNHGIMRYLPQELGCADRSKSVYDFLLEEPMFSMKDSKEIVNLEKQMRLEQGFFYSTQKMNTLSGGERIKIQMARILMAEPNILLLDEPSNDIDITTLEWLEKFILDWKGIIIYISHDEMLIEKTANVIIHLEQIRRKTISKYTVCNLPYKEYVTIRKNDLLNQERKALNDKRLEQIRQEKFRVIQQKVEHDLNAISRQDPHGGKLLKKKMKAVKSLEKRYEREEKNMVQMPEVEEAIFFKFNPKVKIPMSKIILNVFIEKLEVISEDNNFRKLLSQNISLYLKGARKICIVGENGVGKSTLIKKIIKVLCDRNDIKVGYMPQEYSDLLDMRVSPIKFLQTTGEKEEHTKICTYLGSMKYTSDEMNHPISELSGGQRAKLLLLKMCISDAEVLVLDEPTRNFSPLSYPVIRNMLIEYPGAIISVSHDRKFISEVCDEVYELTQDGLIKIRGKYK